MHYSRKKIDEMSTRLVHCDSCAVLVINNHIVHEFGCPEAFKDEIRHCKWCGGEFQPEFSKQYFCSDSCNADYYGIPYEDEEADKYELDDEEIFYDN